jgi:hypothetical protein
MIDIQSPGYYEAIHGLRTIFNDDMRAMLGITGRKLSDRFTADKEMIARLEAVEAEEAEEATKEPAAEATATEATAAEATAAEATAADATAADAPGSRMRPLADMVEKYYAGVDALNIRDWVVRDRGYGFGRTLWRFLTLLVTFPVFLYGFITNIFPFWLPVYLVRNIKDRQFHSSVKVGLGLLVIFPLWYVLVTVAVGIATGPWWIWVAVLVSLFPAGKAALFWYFRWKKSCRGVWFRWQVRRRKPRAVELMQLREEIIAATRELVRNPVQAE